MNTFSIKLFDSTQEEKGELFQHGIITIGEFQEPFLSSLAFWAASDYSYHWREAVLRLLSGNNHSALITDMYDPSLSDCIEWWTMYRVKDMLYVQNSLLIFSEINKPFDLSNPFRYIPKRRKVTEEGRPVSEWSVPFNALEDFYYQEMHKEKV
jgi:hypothetical protein